MPKKVEIRYDQDKIKVLVKGLNIDQIEECANVLLEAIIVQRKIKQNEESTKHAKLGKIKGGNLFSSQ